MFDETQTKSEMGTPQEWANEHNKLSGKPSPQPLYLCDRKACKQCNGLLDGKCMHTSDISHAINFEEAGGLFYENPHNK